MIIFISALVYIGLIVIAGFKIKQAIENRNETLKYLWIGIIIATIISAICSVHIIIKLSTGG